LRHVESGVEIERGVGLVLLQEDQPKQGTMGKTGWLFLNKFLGDGFDGLELIRVRFCVQREKQKPGVSFVVLKGGIVRPNQTRGCRAKAFDKLMEEKATERSAAILAIFRSG